MMIEVTTGVRMDLTLREAEVLCTLLANTKPHDDGPDRGPMHVVTYLYNTLVDNGIRHARGEEHQREPVSFPRDWATWDEWMEKWEADNTTGAEKDLLGAPRTS